MHSHFRHHSGAFVSVPTEIPLQQDLTNVSDIVAKDRRDISCVGIGNAPVVLGNSSLVEPPSVNLAPGFLIQAEEVVQRRTSGQPHEEHLAAAASAGRHLCIDRDSPARPRAW